MREADQERRRCDAPHPGRCRPTPAANGQPRPRPALAAPAPGRLAAGTEPGPRGRGGRRPSGPRPGPGPRPGRARGRPVRPPPAGSCRGRAWPRSSPTARRRYPRWPGRWCPTGPAGPDRRRSDTAVVGPLSRATAPEDAASRRAASIRSGPGSAPVSRAYSPSWGVRTTRDRAWSESSPPTRPRAKRPSASTTTGTGDSATRRFTSAAVPSSRPSPGPTTTAAHRDAASSAAADQPGRRQLHAHRLRGG